MDNTKDNADQLRAILNTSLAQLGVVVAGTHEDPLRWSRSDLLTDLVPLIRERVKELYELDSTRFNRRSI